MTPHIARIQVSPEHIAKALHFPDGTDIFAAQVERGTFGHVVVLGVEHPDLPFVEQGEVAPLISPILTYHRESWDFDWNAQPEHDLQMDDEGEFPHPEELADEEVLRDAGE